MTHRTRVKICGITRVQDALDSARAGVDSIGLNFHRPSARFVDLDRALEIRAALPPFVTLTALFLDETDDWVTEVVYRLRPDCLQFHGREEPDFCAAWHLFDLFPYGYVKQACKIAGMQRPRAWSTG